MIITTDEKGQTVWICESCDGHIDSDGFCMCALLKKCQVCGKPALLNARRECINCEYRREPYDMTDEERYGDQE